MSRIFVWPAGRALARRKSTTALAIHCTATREGKDIDATTVDHWHLTEGWSGIGYHYLIRLDGSIEAGRPEEAIGSHVKGPTNHTSVGIVYVGGLDSQGRAKDTRTPEQKAAMAQLVRSLKAKYRFTKIGGHRDFSPDKDGDGVVEPFEWLKACPCFDVTAWLKAERI